MQCFYSGHTFRPYSQWRARRPDTQLDVIKLAPTTSSRSLLLQRMQRWLGGSGVARDMNWEGAPFPSFALPLLLYFFPLSFFRLQYFFSFSLLPSFFFFPSSPFLLFSPLSFSYPSLSFSSSIPHLCFLEAGPLNLARGFGERCMLPQRGLGRSRNQIWCTIALKYWWRQF